LGFRFSGSKPNSPLIRNPMCMCWYLQWLLRPHSQRGTTATMKTIPGRGAGDDLSVVGSALSHRRA